MTAGRNVSDHEASLSFIVVQVIQTAIWHSHVGEGSMYEVRKRFRTQAPQCMDPNTAVRHYIYKEAFVPSNIRLTDYNTLQAPNVAVFDTQ